MLAPHTNWILNNRMLAAPALLEEARLQEGQGHADEARRAYSRFLGWYDLPASRERHLLEEARAALAGLSGEKEGVRESSAR